MHRGARRQDGNDGRRQDARVVEKKVCAAIGIVDVAAQDAAVQMRALGFGHRTPVYYDMEAFHEKVRRKALRFLSEWTAELHRLG